MSDPQTTQEGTNMANISKDNGTAVKSVKSAVKKPTALKAVKKPSVPSTPATVNANTTTGIDPNVSVTYFGQSYSLTAVQEIIALLKAETVKQSNARRAADAARKAAAEARNKRQIDEIKNARKAAAAAALKAIDDEFNAKLAKLGVKVTSAAGKAAVTAPPKDITSMTPEEAAQAATAAGIAVANLTTAERKSA